MADFSVQGLNDLMLSMQEIEEIPENVVDDMLNAAAEIGTAAMKTELQGLGLVETGQLINSLRVLKKKDKNGKLYYRVYPSGSRKNSIIDGRLRRVSIKGRRKNGSAIKMGNNDVGFVLEFGAPRANKRAYQWLRSALEASADSISAEQTRIFDKWLKSKNL